MTFNRRKFVRAAGATAAASALGFPAIVRSQAQPIRIGLLTIKTGALASGGIDEYEILHLNPLQEALQPEGNTNFAGLLRKIETVCRKIGVPVFVKEVGFGISGSVAAKLVEAGVSGIDVAGAGGTSFSRIEVARKQCRLQDDAFSSWGITTAESLTMVRSAVPGLPVIASGGIRSGVEIAKAIALGANAVGIGAPLLRHAQYSASDVVQHLNDIISDLKIASNISQPTSLDQNWTGVWERVALGINVLGKELPGNRKCFPPPALRSS